MSYSKILIAIDNSASSFHAAESGLELAKALKAAVGLIFVVDKDLESLNGDLFINPANSQVLMIKEAEANINSILGNYKDIGSVHRFMPKGIPHEEISNAAIEWQADLIVIGTHGRSSLEHLLFGSVVEHVIKHSNVPVMVVRKEKINNTNK